MDALTLLWVLVPVTAIATSFINAPYGKHYEGMWGPTLPSRLAWMIMESPTLFLGLPLFVQGRHSGDFVPRMLLALHQCHYLQRVLIYPLRTRTGGKRVPLLIAVCAFGFNILNTPVQMHAISDTHLYRITWLYDPRFLLGLVLFLVGLAANIHADGVLISLRRNDQDRSYHIPRGGLFELVTCANYFAELVEWIGWAICTWSNAGLAFALYTAANLGPRACRSHQWYRRKFPAYPKERKAMIPFLW